MINVELTTVTIVRGGGVEEVSLFIPGGRNWPSFEWKKLDNYSPDGVD